VQFLILKRRLFAHASPCGTMLSGRFSLYIALATSALGAQLTRLPNPKPGQFLELSPNSGQKKDLAHSCLVGTGVEETLDKLSYALFERAADRKAGGLKDAVSLASGALPASEVNSVFAKASTARLQKWFDAVSRTERKLKHTVSFSGYNPLDLLLPLDNLSAPSNATQVLPPACPAFVPKDDPYWSQEEPYWVEDVDGVMRPYAVCMYSKNCTQNFTNIQRVSSLRAVIHATHQLLQKNKASYMLYGGTAIGAHRCEDVLPWDVDTDITVNQDDFGGLVRLLDNAKPRLHDEKQYQGHTGRWIDLAEHGVPGFTLMEKFPGCLPLIVVDQQTGFFTDMFPMKAHAETIYTPWVRGRVSCNSWEFSGCNWNLCDTWATANTLPTTGCQIHKTPKVSCAHDTAAFLQEYYGSSIGKPDRPVRDKALLQTANQDKTEDPASGVYFVIITVAFAVPVVMGCIGVPVAAVIFTFYLGLYMTWAMLTYATRGESYNSGILVLNALLFKLLISFGLWRSWEGASFLELPQAAWQSRGTLVQYVVPASLYALSDVIRVNALRALDASTFAILFNSRMLFLAFVWQWVMDRKLFAIHWLSLLFVMVGCCLKEYPNIDDDSHAARHWAYVEIAILGVITSFATVWNEMLLQKRSEVGVSLQNLAMYMWGTIFTIVMVCVWSIWNPSEFNNPLDTHAWKAIWGRPLVLTSALVLAIYGVATAYFLRYLSNITREVTLGAAAPLLSVVMDFFLFKITMGAIEYVGLILVLLGVVLFAFKPVLAIDAERRSKSPKESSRSPREPSREPGDGSSTIDTPTKETN
jgi:drug/metabolite transporter (DMT)-like permease